jgi:hypothetical protein
MTKSKKIAIIIAILLVVNIGLIFVSQYLFLNSNIYKSVFSLAKVKISGDEIVKMSENPEIYVTDSSLKIEDFFSEMGFEEIESKRLGSKLWVSKGGDEYSVLVNGTRFYTIYLVEKNSQ